MRAGFLVVLARFPNAPGIITHWNRESCEHDEDWKRTNSRAGEIFQAGTRTSRCRGLDKGCSARR